MDTKDEFESEMDEIIEQDKKGLLKNVGIGIRGLEDVPASIIPVPFVRLVQPTSTKTEMSNGKEAPTGHFFYNDTKSVTDAMKIVILRGKHALVEYDRDGEKTKSSKLGILGWDLIEAKLFILSLSVMSFSNFGSLVAQLKQAGVEDIWTKEIVIKSEKQENEKGKYYVAKFEIGDNIPEKLAKELEAKYFAFGGVLDRQPQEEEKEVEVVQS